MDKRRRMRGDCRAALVYATALVLLALPAAGTAQISLTTAVNLAEKNSTNVHAALADVRRAAAVLSEAKDAYIPNFVLGVSPGYAYGFPLGYPSFFNANAASLVYSWSQPDYLRAGHAGVRSAALALKDAQEQVAVDVSLDYVQLNHDLEMIAALDEEKGYADSLVQIEGDRTRAGVDPHVSELQAELTAAQIDQKRIHLENDADDMRQKIGHLTGLPADGLTTKSGSVPPIDTAQFDDPDPQSAERNPGIAAAYANAKAKYYTAFGDEKQNYRPTAAFGAQYALFEKTPGYTEYYRNFQYNNVELGVQVTFPLFDASRRAKARQSEAEAARAQADAEQSRDVLSEQTSAMRHALRELAAQQKVNQLQSQLAREQLQAIETQFANGTGSPNASPVTPKEQQQAHIEERERYQDMLEANFSLEKVQLNLLRATGQLDGWLRSAQDAAPSAPQPSSGMNVSHSVQEP